MRLDDPFVFRSIAENLQIGLYLTDRDRRIVFWNREAERLTGYMQHEVLGRFCRDGLLMHCDAEGKLLCTADCPLSKAMRDGAPQEALVYLQHKARHRVPVRLRAFPVRLSDGVIVGAAESFEEQPTLLLSERRLAALAAHGCLDAATGLPNRFIMESHLRQHLSLFNDHHLPFGVLIIEVEQVSQFEAAHSREALNAVLHAFARSISHLLGSESLLGHWTEHQFLAVVPDCSLTELERFRRQIRDLVKCSGVQWWGDDLSVTAAVGYVMAESGDCVDSIIARLHRSLEQYAARGHDRLSQGPHGPTQPSRS